MRALRRAPIGRAQEGLSPPTLDVPFAEGHDSMYGPSSVRRWAYAVSKLYEEHLCFAYRGEYVSRAKLAELACEIEIDKLGEPIGKQDQYGCALGGVNLIEFHTDGSVTHETVPLTITQRREMEQNLVMFYLGGTRSASELLSKQSQGTIDDPQVVANLKSMVEQARSLRADLCRDVDLLGPYLHEGWLRKRSLSSEISNSVVESAYERALAAGATGGKLLGAGGSGFLLLYAPGDAREAVAEALADYEIHPVHVDTAGSAIIYSD